MENMWWKGKRDNYWYTFFSKYNSCVLMEKMWRRSRYRHWWKSNRFRWLLGKRDDFSSK